MNSLFEQYTIDYISGVTSLRKPQKKSLEILEDILKSIEFNVNIENNGLIDIIHEKYPTCSDFEHNFPSLAFSLATGVGKTRLMGVFIAYLYTHYDIKNYFIVAPNTTIYNKLNYEFSNPGSDKYIFKGLGCFSNHPLIIDGENYNERSQSLNESDVHIYVFNIDKFNKENTNMRKISEYLGDSFFNTISSLKDLVLIMDESHHYRADAGWNALNELHPLLGIELTATPIITKTQETFKNVVYEYPLSEAISDGYTRTPYALASANMDVSNFTDEYVDKLMISDGIKNHENIKRKLQVYSDNNNVKSVKPFVLIVCTDTEHADWVKDYITSTDFKDGYYRNRTIVIHSKQGSTESEQNTKLLLEIEKPDNPIEIVIHVNKLKEGWDVNNLYTIIPLRTAASKVLREQMVGRGLRLPYGKRTGDRDIDAVVLTAHRNFSDILEEARRGDSIFRAGNIIIADDIEEQQIVHQQLSFVHNEDVEQACEEMHLEVNPNNAAAMQRINDLIDINVGSVLTSNNNSSIEEKKHQAATQVIEQVSNDENIADIINDGMGLFANYVEQRTNARIHETIEHFIPIPNLKVTDIGYAEYIFSDFDLDMEEFVYSPIQNEQIIQNLLNQNERRIENAGVIDFRDFNARKELFKQIKNIPELDYDKTFELIVKLHGQFYSHFLNLYGEDGVKNIILFNSKQIAKKIYNQMLRHAHIENNLLKEEVVDVNLRNYSQTLSGTVTIGLWNDYSECNINNIVYYGIVHGVFSQAKFDSRPELEFARILEKDANGNGVVNWLRPAPTQFNITYNGGKRYEPDFVVETDDTCYLVEVKDRRMINDPDVIAKRVRSIQYCKAASIWAIPNGYKPWKHVFIPDNEIDENKTFKQLAIQYEQREE